MQSPSANIYVRKYAEAFDLGDPRRCLDDTDYWTVTVPNMPG
jgi:hypothetical protein